MDEVLDVKFIPNIYQSLQDGFAILLLMSAIQFALMGYLRFYMASWAYLPLS